MTCECDDQNTHALKSLKSRSTHVILFFFFSKYLLFYFLFLLRGLAQVVDQEDSSENLHDLE